MRRVVFGAAVLVVACTAAACQAASPAADPRLTTVALDSAHIRLAWTRMSGASSYRISRNGLLIGVTGRTGFVDSLLWPRTRYRYTLVALAHDGTTLSRARASAQTRPLPAAGFPQPLPQSSFWYAPVGDTPIAPDSAQLSTYVLAHASSSSLALHQWAVAVAEAQPGAPRYKIPCTAGWKCTLNAFGPVPVPVTAQPDPGGDGHLAVYDPQRKLEWDMWRAARTGTGWTAASGAAARLGAPPSPVAGADAANFPLLGGLIRPEEILQGHIDHALVFGVPGIRAGSPICPAAHNAPTTDDPNAPREGQRVQLDPSLDVDALPIPSWEKVIARAMQVYGMYLRDHSGTLAVYAENPISRGYDAWAKVGLGGVDSVSLAGIPWDRLRFLAAPDWPNCGRS